MDRTEVSPGCASCTGNKSSNSQNSTSGCPRIVLVREGFTRESMKWSPRLALHPAEKRIRAALPGNIFDSRENKWHKNLHEN